MLARKVDTSSDSSMFACFGTFVDSDAGRKGEAEIGPGRFLALCSGMAENRGEYNCEKEMQSSAENAAIFTCGLLVALTVEEMLHTIILLSSLAISNTLDRVEIPFGRGWRWHRGDAPDGPG